MDDCVFCRIIRGELPSTKVFENDEVLAIRDIDPKAPHHVILMPKAHVADVTQAGAVEVAAPLFAAIGDVAKVLGVEASGFRTIINTGRDAGQSVPHLHLHLLAGRALSWPPG